MITRVPENKKPEQATAGIVQLRTVRILKNTKAEIIDGEGKHSVAELSAGEIYQTPVWSANHLVRAGLAEFA